MEYHDDDGTLYSVGDIVVVFARTWPGINKPGGVGRIVKVRKNEGVIPRLRNIYNKLKNRFCQAKQHMMLNTRSKVEENAV
jgi:hypothetical protein